MAEFSFGFTEGSFLQLNGQKDLRSVAEELISNKQKRTISQQVITLSDFYSACENKYQVMKTSMVAQNCHSKIFQKCE